MARIYTTKVPEDGRHFKIAPYVTTNVPGRAGWYGYALERRSDGTVTVVWTEQNSDVVPSQKVVEQIAFDDVIWIEGLPGQSNRNEISITFTLVGGNAEEQEQALKEMTTHLADELQDDFGSEAWGGYEGPKVAGIKAEHKKV